MASTSGLPTVIKYEGGNEVFISKYPQEDFYTGSVLIVHESQEAVFFSSGEALDSFGPGSYPIEVENLPLASRFFNRVTGDKTPFHCEVYFINKTEQMAIKWGTDTKLEIVEPTYGFPIQLGASGEMSLRVEDGRKLLIKVVGTEIAGAEKIRIKDINSNEVVDTALSGYVCLSQEQLVRKMRGFLMTKVKPYLAWVIRENKLNIFEIDEHLDGISEALRETLAQDFDDYGLSLERFFVTTIVKPEDDPNYRRFKDLHFRQYADVAEAKLRQQVGVIDQETEAKRMVIEAQGLAQKRHLEGYTYQDERGFNVAEKVASNEAVGQIGNIGVGMGMISGVGGVLGSKVGDMMHKTLEEPQKEEVTNPAGLVCAKCGIALADGAKFCPECGEKVQRTSSLAPGFVVCPSCGKEVPMAKFCLECGMPLVLKCANCGSELQPGAKFCPECGTKVNQPSVGE